MRRLAFIACALASSTALASDLKVKLHGMLEFQSSQHLEMHSKAHARLEAQGSTASDIDYGGKIVVATTTKQNDSTSLSGSKVFIGHKSVGTIEVGAAPGASYEMCLSAYSIARATGDDTFGYVNLNHYRDYGLIIDSTKSRKGERPRKVSYFSPKVQGFQLGMSYVPDIENTGAGGLGRYAGEAPSRIALFNGQAYEVNYQLKKALSVGLSYEFTGDDFSFKVSAVGEGGKTSFTTADEFDFLSNRKIGKARVYNLGGVITYGQWSFGASYANLGKSFVFDGEDRTTSKNTKYTAGIAYSYGPAGISFTYYGSEELGRHLDTYTVGTDCTILSGLNMYVDYTHFKMRNKNIPNTKKTEHVVLTGLKISF